jgi:predicted metalloprotease with PDZ domain|tara:strand:+ start:486 stop:809 length:324 start_codon:yes stop_codon:yes gene_type:complete
MKGIDYDTVAGTNDISWYNNLYGVLLMLDETIRISGRDEKSLKHFVGEFIWKVVQANLDYATKEDWSDVGTQVKFAGEPGISHLVAEYKVRDYGTPAHSPHGSPESE